MNLNLMNKIVVVTGGSAGIGKSIAFEFAREGSKVVVFSRDIEKLEALQAEFTAAGYPLFYEQVDVRDLARVESFAQKIHKKFGSIDVWVNNAGINIRKPCMKYTMEDWDNIVGINLKAVFFCTQIAAKYMMKQKTGVIINASSFSAKIPVAGEILYAMTKAGIQSLIRTFASELAPYNIRVLGFMPAITETEMTSDLILNNKESIIKNISLHRVGKPIDIARPVVFLASEAASFITGVSLEIDGGKFAVQNPDFGWVEYNKTQD